MCQLDTEVDLRLLVIVLLTETVIVADMALVPLMAADGIGIGIALVVLFADL